MLKHDSPISLAQIHQARKNTNILAERCFYFKKSCCVYHSQQCWWG